MWNFTRVEIICTSAASAASANIMSAKSSRMAKGPLLKVRAWSIPKLLVPYYFRTAACVLEKYGPNHDKKIPSAKTLKGRREKGVLSYAQWQDDIERLNDIVFDKFHT